MPYAVLVNPQSCNFKTLGRVKGDTPRQKVDGKKKHLPYRRQLSLVIRKSRKKSYNRKKSKSHKKKYKNKNKKSDQKGDREREKLLSPCKVEHAG